MKIFRIGLHSLILALVNIGFIIIGFRINKFFSNEIAVQTPFAAILSVATFTGWCLLIQYLFFEKFVVWRRNELVWICCLTFLWSPLIFVPLHRIRWGYPSSVKDILSIWLFQLFVNPMVLWAATYLNQFGKPFMKSRVIAFSEKRQHNLLINTFLVIASSVFSLLFIEFMLQGLYTLPPIISGWRSNAPDSEKNQLGFRGQSIKYSDDDIVIILLGDSQVEARACAYEWMPERRLEYYLNSFGKQVKVFSLGASGYGQDQQLLVLQEYYQTYRADMVILWQVPANDVWNNTFPTHWPANGSPKPTFWLENGEDLQGPSEQMEEELHTSPIKLIALYQRVFEPLDRDGEWEKYLPQPYTPMIESSEPVHKKWQKLWDDNFAEKRHENLDNEKSHYAILLTPRSARMEYGLKLTRRLLNEINKLVTSHNGQLFLFRKEAPAEERFSDGVYVLNGKYYRISREQFESNVQFINQGFQSYNIPITVKHWRVGPEDGHLNEHATDQVMKDLAAILEGIILDRN